MAKIKRKVLVLQFEDPDYEGVQIKAHATSMGRALALSDEADAARKPGAGLDEVRDLLDEFITALQSWNLEDENDEPIPATREGFLTLDIPAVMDILLAWFDAMMTIGPGLGKDSTFGEQSQEVSIPMEPLSANPAN